MTELASLYALAERDGIRVERFPLPRTESLSLMDREGNCYIALDPAGLHGSVDEKMKLSHELGHCETGSFYCRSSKCDLRARHEVRALRWQIKKLIPRKELEEALQSGCTQAWELAERFGVTEAFVKAAVAYYRVQG